MNSFEWQALGSGQKLKLDSDSNGERNKLNFGGVEVTEAEINL